jgi:hypothetical protein
MDRSVADWLSQLKRPGWANYTFAFHDGDEVGAGLLAQIAKKTGLQPEDLSYRLVTRMAARGAPALTLGL